MERKRPPPNDQVSENGKYITGKNECYGGGYDYSSPHKVRV